MIKKALTAAIVIVSVLFLWLYGYQEQEQEIPLPEKHEVAVRLVLLDVIVTKGGEFVKDLTKDDFELFEDGKKDFPGDFFLIGEDQKVNPLSGELIVTSWNDKTRIWSGIFFIDISAGSTGRNNLYVEIPGREEGTFKSIGVSLTILR